MPLFHSKSDKAFSHNVATEMDAGKPQKQSLAIAYSIKRRAKKAKGGAVTVDNYDTGSEMSPPGQEPQPATKMMAEGSEVCPQCGMLDCTCCEPAKMSEGGKVANAGGDPSHIDELALDDDLAFSETGANSGDELGDSREESDRKGIIDRIMSALAKRDKMPRPA